MLTLYICVLLTGTWITATMIHATTRTRHASTASSFTGHWTICLIDPAFIIRMQIRTTDHYTNLTPYTGWCRRSAKLRGYNDKVISKIHLTLVLFETFIISSSHKSPDWTCSPPSRLFIGWGGWRWVFFHQRWTDQDVKITTHLHLTPRIGITGGIPLLPTLLFK